MKNGLVEIKFQVKQVNIISLITNILLLNKILNMKNEKSMNSKCSYIFLNATFTFMSNSKILGIQNLLL